MLEGRNDGLEKGTARGALESSVFDLAGFEPSPVRYPGCLKQLLNHFFSAAPVPKNSFYS